MSDLVEQMERRITLYRTFLTAAYATLGLDAHTAEITGGTPWIAHCKCGWSEDHDSYFFAEDAAVCHVITRGLEQFKESVRRRAPRSATLTPDEAEPTVLADLEEILDAAVIGDNYGVPGSDFIHCLKCGQSNGPGKYWKDGDWHEPGCAVKRMRLKYELDKPSATSDGTANTKEKP